MDLSAVELQRVPRHIAAVMDGTGRWAQSRGLRRTDGHAAGEEALFDAVHGAIEMGVDWFTVYAFSTENWRRPASEVRFLMKFNEGLLVNRRDELDEMGVRIRFIGRRDWRVPKRLLRHIDRAEAQTEHNTTLNLTIAFNYGGRAEIVDAVRSLVANGVEPSDITEDSIAAQLYVPEAPMPDLMVRTSGEFRLSNYLVWQLAYTELVFVDTLWPDFRREHLRDAVIEFQQRDRRFGGLS